MLLHIPTVLDQSQLAECRKALDQAEWADGRATAGYQSARVKNNQQLPERHPVAVRLGDMILTALDRNPLFMSGGLPLKVVPPLFNRYENSQTYGNHIDGAIRPIAGTPHRVRTDLSATLFLTPPEDYDGGELVIEDTFGAQRVKLKAGDMILYPGSSLHRVEPVTRGVRTCAFFWIQSMVRDDAQRRMLFELDTTIQQLARTVTDQTPVVTLTNLYHNLLRQWADA
ncbi:MAG TPA: Fe2+-dependent dioxygenase [Alphaproteobacteria bacterium]|nr:Fe2+-dependent dioxygenase [Alphaproteobacteria bacterium]